MNETLSRPRHLRALLAFREKDTATARELQTATGYEKEELAAAVRRHLAALGLVTVEDKRLPILSRVTGGGRVAVDLLVELDALVPGLIDRRNALPALLIVHENMPEPTSAAQLRAGLKLRTVAAARVRDDLVALKVFTVEEGLENRVRFVRTRTTPLGRKAGDLAQRFRDAIESARQARKR